MARKTQGARRKTQDAIACNPAFQFQTTPCPTTSSTTPSTTVSTTTPSTTASTTTSSTTHPTSTSTTSSSSTTTTTTTTTTTPHGNCATVTTCNIVTNNITLLLSAIDYDQQYTNHWNSSLIATFSGYKGRIWVISTNSSTSATASNKFNAIKSVLLNFTTKADFKAIVMAIFIQTWGTIAEYCACSM